MMPRGVEHNRRDFIKIAAAAMTAAAATKGAIAAASQKSVKLRKAVLVSMLPKEMSYADRFKLAVDVGFEAMEAQTVSDPKEAEQIRQAADQAKLRIHSVMNMDHWKFPLSSGDPAVVERSMKGMETSINNAKLWGADTVLLVPAVVDPQTSYKDAYVRSQAQIKKLIPLAAQAKVVIAVEEVWNKFLLSPLEFAKYVDELNSPWVKAYFDVGNIVRYGYPQDWIRTLGSRIVKFHLKDFSTDTQKFVPLREGSIDWPEVRRAIGDINYDGYLTVELPDGNQEYLRDVSKRVDLILGAAPAA